MEKFVKILKIVGAFLALVFTTVGGIFLYIFIGKKKTPVTLTPTIKVIDVDNKNNGKGLDDAVANAKDILSKVKK